MVSSLTIVMLFGSLSGAMSDTHDPERLRSRPIVQRSNESAIPTENLEHYQPLGECSSRLKWVQGDGPLHMCANTLVMSPVGAKNISKTHCRLLADNIRALKGYWETSEFRGAGEFSNFWSARTCSLEVSILDGPTTVDIGNLDIADFLEQAINTSQDSHIQAVVGKTICASGINTSGIIMWRVGLPPGSTPSSANTIIPIGIFAICMIVLWFSVTWPFSAG
ncbi:hypothetical protein F5X99DRAFT_419026 [Biscogniauxia marginata]|nr:hypothetical protein F5X99DRAFT_419026 [Biscogniauxia marginata]